MNVASIARFFEWAHASDLLTRYMSEHLTLPIYQSPKITCERLELIAHPLFLHLDILPGIGLYQCAYFVQVRVSGEVIRHVGRNLARQVEEVCTMNGLNCRK